MLVTRTVIVPDLIAEDGDVRLEIYQEQDSLDPRESDNLGMIVCWHKRYNLGDKHDYDSPMDFLNAFNRESEYWNGQSIAVKIPLYLFDHSGLSMTTRASKFVVWDGMGWDWGQVGWIYVTEEKLKNIFPLEKYGKELLDKAEEMLEQEVITYDQYLKGEIFYFSMKKGDELLDSCSGFYGSNFKENGMADHIGEKYGYLIDKLRSP